MAAGMLPWSWLAACETFSPILAVKPALAVKLVLKRGEPWDSRSRVSGVTTSEDVSDDRQGRGERVWTLGNQLLGQNARSG